MKHSYSTFGLVIVGLCVAVVPANGSVNVTQHHNHDSRDGLYIDPVFTQTAAAGLTRDLSFDGTIVGNVYAQPLYIEDGPGGRAMVIAVTESNNVYALDAAMAALFGNATLARRCQQTILYALSLILWASPARPLLIWPRARSF